jgi:hypothetical protein
VGGEWFVAGFLVVLDERRKGQRAMGHKYRSIVLLGALVALTVGVSASAANAAIKYEWKVKGSALAAESSKEFTVKDKTEGLIDINIEYGGNLFEYTSSKVKITHGAIVGGKPGKIEGTLEFENLAVKRPAGCTLTSPTKIVTRLLKGEIVEAASAEKGLGKTEVLFTPWEGTTFTEFEIKGGPTCSFNGDTFIFSGSLLAEMSPQLSEAKIGKLLFGTEASKDGEEYRNSAGTFQRANLDAGPASLWLKGEPEMELVSGEAFGAF